MLDATCREVNSLGGGIDETPNLVSPLAERWTAGGRYDSGRLLIAAPVVKWISYRPPEPGVEVRFLSGAWATRDNDPAVARA